MKWLLLDIASLLMLALGAWLQFDAVSALLDEDMLFLQVVGFLLLACGAVYTACVFVKICRQWGKP